MIKLTLKPNENIIDYVINHSEELSDAKICLDEVDNSKYGFIESKNYRVLSNLRPFPSPFDLSFSNYNEMLLIDFEYFLKGRKDVSMLVRETIHTGFLKPSYQQILKVFKNKDYEKTLFSTTQKMQSNAVYLVSSKARKSAFLNDNEFVVGKNDCVSDFIVKNKGKFTDKSIIITDKELNKKYLRCSKVPFIVTPVDYKFDGQQNVVLMELTPIENAPGNYYVTNIIKKIHIATPVYDSANASNSKLVQLSETKEMIK